jgi:hypothetical protein
MPAIRVRGPGIRVVEAYLALYIFLPALGSVVFGENIVTGYRIEPHGPEALLFAIIVFGLVLLFRTMARDMMPGINYRWLARSLKKIGMYYLRLRLLVVSVGVLSGIWFLSLGLSGYRYSYTSISESLSPSLLLGIFFNIVLSADALYSMFASPRVRIPIFSRVKLENILLALALILFSNGTMGMFAALIFSVYAIFPKGFRRLIFAPSRRRWASQAKQVFRGGALFVVIFSVAWTLGESIKVSTSNPDRDRPVGDGLAESGTIVVLRMLEEPEVRGNFGYYVIGSLSHHYYSLLMTFGSQQRRWSEENPLKNILKTLSFRADILLGSPLGISRPEGGALGQLNYQLLDTGPLRPREGTSEGVLASFKYVSPFPVAIILAALYLSLFSAMVDKLVRGSNGGRLTYFGLGFLLFFLLIFLQSPMDHLMVLDDGVATVLLILAISLSGVKKPGLPIPSGDTRNVRLGVAP